MAKIGLPRCSPQTFAYYDDLRKQKGGSAAAATYKANAQKTCSFDSTDLKGYVSIDGTLRPFASDYTDPNFNTTGTCYADLKPISADTWNSMTQGLQMTKDDFCNLATIDIGNKTILHGLESKIKATLANIITKINNLEIENENYYLFHDIYDKKLTKDIATYKIFSQRLRLLLHHPYRQPDITLGGQVDDAKLLSKASYYRFIIWGIAAATAFTYTMGYLRR